MNSSALFVDGTDTAKMCIVSTYLGKALWRDTTTSCDSLKKGHDISRPLWTTKADQQHRVDIRHNARLPLAKRR